MLERDVAEQGQEDVDPELHADADLQEDAERRQQDGADDAKNVHSGHGQISWLGFGRNRLKPAPFHPTVASAAFPFGSRSGTLGRSITRIGTPEVQLGIIPAWGGTVRLPRLVGLQRSLELILTGRAVAADEWVSTTTRPSEPPMTATFTTAAP